MTIEIIKKQENKLLGRTEIKATITKDINSPTMKRIEVKKVIAKHLKVDEKFVVVNKITSYFGNNQLNVLAKIYNDEKSLKTNARPHMIKRNTIEVKKEEGED